MIKAGDAITEYDTIRILPFGGIVTEVTMKGSLVDMVLDQGVANAGTGGFLGTANVTGDTSQWFIGGVALDPDATYTVAINDFLLTGLEVGLPYLTPANPDLDVVAEHSDVRFALIAELEAEFN